MIEQIVLLIITMFLSIGFTLYIVNVWLHTEKYGEWRMYPDESEIYATEFICSKCRESFCSSDLTDEQFLEIMKHCPNCGAKMGK